MSLRFKTFLFFENVREKMAHDNTGPHSPTIEEEGDYSEIYSRENLNSYPSQSLHKERNICPFSTQSRNKIGRYSGSLDKILCD
jgi:hypothetical protein